MSANEEIYNVIYAAIDEFNEQALEGRTKLEKSVNSALYDGSSGMDSLEIASLLMAVEDNLEDLMGVTITIADEKAMSQKQSPFRNVKTLANYIGELLAVKSPG